MPKPIGTVRQFADMLIEQKGKKKKKPQSPWSKIKNGGR